MTTKDHLDLISRYGAKNYAPLPVVLAKGEGVWVWDLEGRKYMDMLSAYSALNQGHRHPRIVAALKEQADRICVTSRAFNNDRIGPFFKRLSEITGLPRVLPMNTGAEAVETGIKTARKWGCKVKGVPEGKARIIACEDNFHGRTTTIVGFSTEAQYRDGFDPVPWYSPANRSSTVGTWRIRSAEKYSSVWGIGVRMSRSPVISIVGVRTLPTYISDDCRSQGAGSSQNGLSKKL